MKKFFVFFIFISFAVLLTGCGQKQTLSCSYTIEDEEYGVQTIEYTLVFEKDEITEGIWVIELKLNAAATPYKDVFYQTYDQMTTAYDDVAGYEAKVSESGDTIKLSVKADFSKISEDNLAEMEFDSTKTYNEIKSSFEEEGFTCK